MCTNLNLVGDVVVVQISETVITKLLAVLTQVSEETQPQHTINKGRFFFTLKSSDKQIYFRGYEEGHGFLYNVNFLIVFCLQF